VVSLPNGDRYEMVPFRELWYWILGFSVFAFMSTLVRELQKDMADVKGDEADGCRTIPIVWGMKWSKAMVLSPTSPSSSAYCSSFVPKCCAIRSPTGTSASPSSDPLLLSAGFTYQAHHREEFVRAGAVMKVAMVMAVGYALLIRFIP
jgi:4-hydroxybenzoate polyprenyltransferase